MHGAGAGKGKNKTSSSSGGLALKPPPAPGSTVFLAANNAVAMDTVVESDQKSGNTSSAADGSNGDEDEWGDFNSFN